MNNKYLLNPLLFGIVLALASVLVVTSVSQHVPGLIGAVVNSQITDLDLEEAVEAENATMTGTTTNQTTTNGNTADVQFLAIQNARSGSVSEINATTTNTLELSNVPNQTILFSDRPERIVTSVSTSGFVGNWSAGQNSFAEDAPNAALVAENTQTGQLGTAIVELFNPVYDVDTNMLTYTIMTENATSIDLADELGQSVLVIDSPPCNPSPNSANGLSLNDCGY